MASIIRNIPKSKFLRNQSLGQCQRRNTSSDVANKQSTSAFQNAPSQSSMVLPMAVGVSLGISVCLAAQGNIKKLISGEPAPEPKDTKPAIDTMFVQEMISQSRKINDLENTVNNLTTDLRDREQQLYKMLQANRPETNVNVIELSQVIEANNLACESRHKRELENREKALAREYLNKLSEQTVKIENKYKPLFNKVLELQNHLEQQKQIIQMEGPARQMWVFCQSLLRSLQNLPPKPLEHTQAYLLLRQFAENGNPLAIKVLDSLPARAIKEGVQSEDILVERFEKVEKVCKKVAMIDENGGGIAKYLISYMQSLFIFDNAIVTDDEILGKTLVDPTSWHTYDILARVRYCLKRRNIEQAIRYANQLKGQARVVARDWIRDARIHLETRQAFDILSTYAEGIAVEALNQNLPKKFEAKA